MVFDTQLDTFYGGSFALDLYLVPMKDIDR